MNVEKTYLRGGVWDILIGCEGEPNVIASYLGQALDGLTVEQKSSDRWKVSVPVPADILSDGVHTLLLRRHDRDDTLAQMTLVAGAPLAGDLQSEVDFLRAELDLLKRAFRRHCADTENNDS
ncbi:hypothetical protein BFP70_06715 [Thioclava sp. SK-1]|uniref:hypothetical protein n=1 Tax=Thioclava sp. SK-1 TaxID=1889770 RepID=UPI000824F71A|nr:hypothetical protein [Thioclava sp. SK-1]OCX65828.1 hypothetical protein BFP70_06715 [Thioclava sp. SK-1]